MAKQVLRAGVNIVTDAIFTLIHNTPLSAQANIVVAPSCRAYLSTGVGFTAAADLCTSVVSPGYAAPALTDIAGPVVCDVGLSLSHHGDLIFDLDTPTATIAASSPASSGMNYDTYYDFIQNTANAVWLIAHGLGRFPNIVVCDSTGEQVIGDVFFPDMNTVRVQFSSAFAGFAHLS